MTATTVKITKPDPLLYWPSSNYAKFNDVVLDMFQIESIDMVMQEAPLGCSPQKACVIRMRSGGEYVFGGEYGVKLWECMSTRVPNII
jgi:hypothetical protein